MKKTSVLTELLEPSTDFYPSVTVCTGLEYYFFQYCCIKLYLCRKEEESLLDFLEHQVINDTENINPQKMISIIGNYKP